MKKILFNFYASIASFILASIDIVLMYFVNFSTNVLNIIIGIIFWVSLIAGIVLLILYQVQCKEFCINNQQYDDIYNKKRIGLISFFSNSFAIVFDIIMIISFVLAVVLTFINYTSLLAYILFAFLLFAFYMHCILNGKSFCISSLVIKNKDK